MSVIGVFSNKPHLKLLYLHVRKKLIYNLKKRIKKNKKGVIICTCTDKNDKMYIFILDITDTREILQHLTLHFPKAFKNAS